MKKFFLSLAFIISLGAFSKNLEETITKEASENAVHRINNSSLSVKVPKYIFSGLNTNIDLVFANPADEKLVSNNNELYFIINGEDQKIHFDKAGVGTFNYTFKDNGNLTIYFEDFNYSSKLHIIPIWYVIIPVGLLVLFLSYKLFRSGRKNKKPELAEVIAEPADEPKEVKKAEVKIKEVVETEEEVFA